MASSRGLQLFGFFVVLGLGAGPARAGGDAGAADNDRYAQRVASAVQSHHGEVKACYAVALERNPRLAGKFDALWTIDTAGKPRSVRFEIPPADSEFAACMIRTISAWRFQAPTEPSEVMFPFVFAADSARAGPAPAQEPAPPAAAAPAPPAAQSPAAEERPPQRSSKPGAAQQKRAPGSIKRAADKTKR